MASIGPRPARNAAMLPLLSTTATAMLAFYEIVFFRGLLKASSRSRQHSSAVARTISLWWHHNLPEGLTVVFAFGLASLVTGIRAARAFRPQSTERYLANAGTILAVGHFAFGPSIAEVIAGMAYAYERAGSWRVYTKAEAEEKGVPEQDLVDEEVLEGQRKWLKIHAWRTVLTDLPALAAFGWLASRR